MTRRLVKGASGALIPALDDVAIAAGRVLSAQRPGAMAPTHYRKLAELTWPHLWGGEGWVPRSVDEARQSAEHLRESASDGVHGLRYMGERALGKRHRDVGLVFLGEWVETGQRSMFADERRSLDYDACVAAASDGALRLPHMFNTFGNSDGVRALRTMKGKIVERHVSDDFRREFPRAWRPASNDGDVTRASADDFRLAYGGRVYLVDVKTPLRDGTVGPTSGRERASIFVVASGDGASVIVHGWFKRAEFMAGGSSPQSARPMAQLYVALNCDARGIDVSAMRAIVLDGVAV